MNTTEQKTPDETPSEIKKLNGSLNAREGIPGNTYLAPLPGYQWNPLRNLNPNLACPCKSGKKFKKCCRNNLPPAVPKEQAEQYKKQMERLDTLVFLTKENEHMFPKETVEKLLPKEPTKNAAIEDAEIIEETKKEA